MQIAGIKKTTLLDYPGKVACLVFTAGCNLRCHQCYNPEFVDPEKLINTLKDLITENAFFNFLESRKDFLEGVVIGGGEPTLQKDIIGFIEKIKKMGFAVKLDTNGKNPEILKELIDKKLIDYIAMDIKHVFEKYFDIVGVKENWNSYLESIQILINSDIDYEFRTTVIKGYHDIQDIEEICKIIKGAKAYYIQNFIGKGILNQNFNGKSFTKSELEELENIIKKYIKVSGIR